MVAKIMTYRIAYKLTSEFCKQHDIDDDTLFLSGMLKSYNDALKQLAAYQQEFPECKIIETDEEF